MINRNSIALILLVFTFGAWSQNLDSVFQYVKYRNIGPFKGGRSVAVSGVVGQPLTYYMGTTGGGVWKTDDAGINWSNISDGFFKTGSVGAIAVSESEPNVVYCGMGEHAPRGVMTSYGDGVYKSTNGGKTWKKLGLEKTQHISRIAVHPKNPNIVYVAAQGSLYGPNKDRGIYKSIDGGKTWKNVLFVNELTGCSELSMDMNDPEVLYAGMWEHQRKPWKVISGGDGSGLYKSTDAGETWEKIHTGLPKEKGKIAVSVCRSNSDKVYALIESDWEKEKGGLYVSNNAGKNWSKVSGEHKLIQRAWYYTEVFTDPNNENVVYVLSAPAMRSIDGGNTWENIYANHGDYHDLWINPNDSKNLVIANDGGGEVSFNYGDSWSGVDKMPTGQIYRINVDNEFPYAIYGGQQDNPAFRLKSMNPNGWSIGENEYEYCAGGESAFLAFDPNNPRYVMGGSYQGTLEFLDMETKVGIDIMAAPIQYLGKDAKDMKYRFNWNAPVVYSKHEANTYYHACQLLLKTNDDGVNWEEISPDLTRNEKEKQGKPGGPYTNEAVGAESYGTISYVIESPQEKGVIWVGTDDGLVQLTKDGGKTWTNITPKGIEECLINSIEVSPHNPAVAYIATTRYKFNDYSPGLYKTTDYGKSWKAINEGIPKGAYTRVVREDEVRKGMLLAGTEMGMFISFNDGAKWIPFQLNLPITPINDLKLKHGNMQIATSGRAVWVFDDLDLLRQYDESKELERLTLYKPKSAILGDWGSPLNNSSKDFKGSSSSSGVNPASGAVIYYQLPKLADSIEIQLAIYNSAGELVNQFSSSEAENFVDYPSGPDAPQQLSKEKGINRFVWDLRWPELVGAPSVYIEGGYSGRRVIPGKYTLKLNCNGEVLTSEFEVLKNPMLEISDEAFEAYDKFLSTMSLSLNDMHSTVNSLLHIREQLENVTLSIGSDKASLKSDGEELIKKMEEWDGKMVQRMSKAYDDVENFENKFTAELLFLIDQSQNSMARINEASKTRYMELMEQWIILKDEANTFIRTDVPNYNQRLWDAGIGAIRMK